MRQPALRKATKRLRRVLSSAGSFLNGGTRLASIATRRSPKSNHAQFAARHTTAQLNGFKCNEFGSRRFHRDAQALFGVVGRGRTKSSIVSLSSTAPIIQSPSRKVGSNSSLLVWRRRRGWFRSWTWCSPEEPVEPISTVERMLYPQTGYVNKPFTNTAHKANLWTKFSALRNAPRFQPIKTADAAFSAHARPACPPASARPTPFRVTSSAAEVQSTSTSSTYADVINYTGKGVLMFCAFGADGAATQAEVTITIDGAATPQVNAVIPPLRHARARRIGQRVRRHQLPQQCLARADSVQCEPAIQLKRSRARAQRCGARPVPAGIVDYFCMGIAGGRR